MKRRSDILRWSELHECAENWARLVTLSPSGRATLSSRDRLEITQFLTEYENLEKKFEESSPSFGRIATSHLMHRSYKLLTSVRLTLRPEYSRLMTEEIQAYLESCASREIDSMQRQVGDSGDRKKPKSALSFLGASGDEAAPSAILVALAKPTESDRESAEGRYRKMSLGRISDLDRHRQRADADGVRNGWKGEVRLPCPTTRPTPFRARTRPLRIEIYTARIFEASEKGPSFLHRLAEGWTECLVCFRP